MSPGREGGEGGGGVEGGEGRRGGKTVVRSSKGYLSIQYFITDRAIGPLSQIS